MWRFGWEYVGGWVFFAGSSVTHRLVITLKDKIKKFFVQLLFAQEIFNCFINGLVNITLRTHDMSHRAKSVTPSSTIELHNVLNRLVIDSPHMGRAEQSQDDTAGNGDGHRSDKRPRNNGVNDNGNGGKKSRPDKPKDGPKVTTRGKGKGKGNMRHKRRFGFNAIVKALTPEE
jgi:hypothetical protein